jgi:hypothetical protein
MLRMAEAVEACRQQDHYEQARARAKTIFIQMRRDLSCRRQGGLVSGFLSCPPEGCDVQS